MKILLKAHTEGDNDGPLYAYIETYEAEEKNLIGLMEVAAELDKRLVDFYHFECWYKIVWLDLPDDIEAELDTDHLYESGFLKLPDDFDLQDEDADYRTERDTITVSPHNIWFSATPKHCDYKISTKALPLEVFLFEKTNRTIKALEASKKGVVCDD